MRGEPQGDVETIGIAKETGTTISFLPDTEVFEETEFSADTLHAAPPRDRVPDARAADRARRRARRTGRRSSSTTRAGSGTSSRTSNESKDPIHRRIVYFEGENDAGRTSRSRCSGTRPTQESVFSFANNINTHEGGTHLPGFRAALTRTINKYARDTGLLKEKEDNLEGEDIREGLAAVISVKLRNPQFEGQTKTKLGNPPVARPRRVRRSTRGSRSSSRRTRRDAKQIVLKAVAASRARQAARKARDLTPQERALRARRSRASSPTASSRTPTRASSSSSRATRRAARRSRAVTGATRRSCRCAGRSSTARRTASTRCSRTTRSRR